MERKNAVLLTVIAVATLLVAVVGATFAYFTATTTPTGEGGTGTVTTTTVGDIDLTMAATSVTNELKYPGGYLAVGASVTATHEGNAAYNLTYDVNGTINNGTNTQLSWTLYEVASTVANPVTGCTLEETKEGSETRYNYTGCTVSTTLTASTPVKTGTVAAKTNGNVLATGETLTSSTSGTVTYYYLVVSYPNSGNQDTDQGANITATLTNVTNAVATAA